MNIFKYLFILLFFFLNLNPIQAETTSSPLILQVKNREITVNGKKAQMYEIAQPNGTQGLFLQKGDFFNVIVENHLDSPTGIHWHGLILPNSQDGVPYVTQLPIPPGGKYSYYFPLIQSGSFWMHAHYGLQEQKLLAAPLILYNPGDKQRNEQDVVMFVTDFTFRNPYEIFKELQHAHSEHMSMPMAGKMPMHMDLNDVKYDAFLTNWRTLSEPDVIQVTPEKTVRLRVINGSSSTNFFIDLGTLKGEAIAIDGEDIIPLSGSRFELAVAQRIDIRLKIPQGMGAYPIIAQGEGLKLQTGLVLATANAKIPQLKQEADQAAGALSYQQELMLQAKHPLVKKKIDRQ